MDRPISFEKARAAYIHRFTMEHIPSWAASSCIVGGRRRHYAPQFRTDREWYEATRFKGEDGWLGRGDDCFTTGQTWPLGSWLDAPYLKHRGD